MRAGENGRFAKGLDEQATDTADECIDAEAVPCIATEVLPRRLLGEYIS